MVGSLNKTGYQTLLSEQGTLLEGRLTSHDNVVFRDHEVGPETKQHKIRGSLCDTSLNNPIGSMGLEFLPT